MISTTVTVLFIADIVGEPGIRVTRDNLAELKQRYNVDLCIANGENASEGIGITKKTADLLFEIGIDVITTGNHFWDKSGLRSHPEIMRTILRPANYPEQNEGTGSTVVHLPLDHKVAVLNVQGRTFMYTIDCPFRRSLEEVKKLREKTKVIVVDMHAEATAEKKALAYHLDGKVSAVIGTHTHVQSADETVLQNGTAFITDAGMTGPIDSVIGLQKDIALKRFIHQTPFRYKVAGGKAQFNGVVIEIEIHSGKAIRITRVSFREN